MASCRVVLPVMGLDAMEGTRERLVEDGVTIEAIFQRDVADAIAVRPAYRAPVR